jgi:hypothetical protein
MLGTISKSLVIGSLLSLTVACGQQQEAKSQKVQAKVSHLRDTVPAANAPAANAPANAALTCDQIWTGFVAANPLGLSKAYQSTVVTEYTGGEGLPAPETVVETSKDTVTASSDVSVSITYEYTSTASATPIPAETQTVNKVDFLASCNAPVVNTPPTNTPTNTTPAAPAPTVTVTEQGTEKLTVKAGSFDTDFVKGTIVQTGDNAYTADAQEWYLTGSDFLVKSIFVSVSTFDTVKVTTSQTVELISYVNPAATTATAAL